MLLEKELSDPENALSVETWTESSLLNGLESTVVYSRSARTLTTTSPAGRVSTTTFDELGRKLLVESPGLPTARFQYDDDGRVIEETSEADGDVRTTSYEYGDDGALARVTGADGNTSTIVRDTLGRAIQGTRADGESALRTFDENGNLLSLTPPGRDAHLFRYRDATNQLTGTVPPAIPDQRSSIAGLGVGETELVYTEDNQLERITRSDGFEIINTYDAESGRLASVDLADAQITYGYDANGALTSINRSDSVRVTTKHDGPLMTGVAWTGAIQGTVSATYDENFRLATMTVNGSSSVTYGYDDDGLVTRATANGVTLALAHDAESGMVGGTALGLVSTAQAYNGFAELSVLAADFDGADLFRQDIERDGLGRITSITEVIGGETLELTYAYDDIGRLVEASRDGTARSYTYDTNGNRLSFEREGAEPLLGEYDAQDRIKSYDALAFEQTAHGDLLRIDDGTDALELGYDELGNLLDATLTGAEGANHLEYVVDGLGRRVAKRVNGSFSKAWLYRDGLRPVSEVDSTGTFMHFIYAGAGNSPDFILRAGVPLRVIKDHLGSVRLVVNAQTGVVEQRLDYDEFGRVLDDTRPGFQPFGYAGGLYDPDTRLTRFGRRDYAADIGRWVTKDPLGFEGGDTNLYAYCANDPINHVDPTGQYLQLPIGAGILAFVGIMLATSDAEVVGAVGGAILQPLLGVAFRALAPPIARLFAREVPVVLDATLDATRPMVAAGGSGPWVPAVVREGGAVAQSLPGSCGAACVQMLSGGAKTEAQAIAEIGQYVTTGDVASSLGKEWMHTLFGSASDAVTAARGGPMAGFLYYPGAKTGHFVAIEPVVEGFLVRDPSPGVTYVVGRDWIERWVLGGVWKR
jgi:RHS repeat-associated protein